MKILQGFITLALLLMLFVPLAFAQEVSMDHLNQMMANSSDNLTTYTYTRTAESKIIYSNDSLNTKFEAVKSTEGKVNLPLQEGWWSHKLSDKGNGEILTWQGYYLNGSEYWKEEQNWTQFNLTDPNAVMEDYNELPSQIDLILYSNMSIAGSDSIDGDDCYRLVGAPIRQITETILGLELYASYLNSPFPLPDDFSNKSFNFDNTSLLENSNVTIVAWVSKKTAILRRIDIDSNLTITPQILKIEEPEFKIQAALHEVTDYQGFGEPVNIKLPAEALKASYRTSGSDWRWAIFGLLEP
ncbi:Uncharacterised protein [uncultured archaeon]|nr:Uncharacterised protein [uncultured archaeon]